MLTLYPTRHAPRRGTVTGMSLLELMVVLLIIGLLASIAYPSYANHVFKARRADGQAALMKIEIEQTRRRAAGLPLSTTLTALGLTEHSPDGHYILTLSVDGPTYVATAVPTRQQTDDPCGTLRVTGTPGETYYDADPGNALSCWGRS